VLRSLLEDFLKQEQGNGATVAVPHQSVELFKISGHWQKYKEDLFPVMGESEDEGFVLKAMNPFHVQIYKRVALLPNPSR